MVKLELHPCFILHYRPYRETSLILDVFSREAGRVSVVAKGAKRQKSKSTGILQIHQKLRLAWSSRGEMGTLTDMEMTGEIRTLSGRCTLSAFYIDELLVRLLHQHEPCPELFDYYEEALAGLTDETEERTLRLFEKRLVESLGYGLVLDHDVDNGKKISAQNVYYYKFDHGPFSTRPSEGDFLEVSGRVLEALRDNDFTDLDIQRQARRLLQPVIRQHIGPKPLKSRELYKAYLDSTRE